MMLNSGSSIRYIKNFEANQRILYLEGEAYFEVSRDSLRPFSVISNGIKTTALGTAFNITSYQGEGTYVSLVEGKVAVDHKESMVALEKGEALNINPETGEIKKKKFDEELVLAWTNKKIIFQQVKMVEAIRVLENWYGVKFKFKNTPKSDLLIYGEYEDEMLENVLKGLSYTARFEYKINQDLVEITFK
ncbi:MAG TPA: FecR domain-containing protein [Algoriphagus sp.]|nr:FecR domain-containing protein [Algoriphagus sp.]